MLKMIAVVDPSGIPIAIYPRSEVDENDFSIFMGVLRSLDNIVQSIEGEPLSCIEVGQASFRFEKIGDYILVAKLEGENWREIDWYFKLLVNALRHSINYVRTTEGLVENYEEKLFKNILRKFYENFEEVKKLYKRFSENYLRFKDNKGESAYQMVNDIFGHELELVEKENLISFKDIKTSDIERFKELIELALSRMESI